MINESKNNDLESDEIEDLEVCAREGRKPRVGQRYRALFANGDLRFNAIVIDDPVPLGRQILASGGVDEVHGYSLFAILKSGDFEDVRLDEPFDLRARGVERFVAFQTDSDYKLTLRGDQLRWGKPAISGAALYKLAKVADDEAVFLEVRGGQDRLTEPNELIDLTDPGIERFVVAPKPASTFEIIVNSRPRVVDSQYVTFEQVVQLAYPNCNEPNVTFSMTYRHAASKPHAGELGPGGSVQVKTKGTIFNVTKTVQS